MNKIDFELHAILACLQDGKGITSAQAKAQEAADMMEERGYFPGGYDAEGKVIPFEPKRYMGPVNHGPGAPLAPPAPVASQGGGGGAKLPGGQVVQAGGSRGSGQTRIVNMTGSDHQPQGRSNGGNRGPNVGRGVAPPVVVKVGQGKPGEGVQG
jgi:hypothetical protein